MTPQPPSRPSPTQPPLTARDAWRGVPHPSPNPTPETAGADRDDDRLATELFRRYGSVKRGELRGREHWVADADAVRHIIGYERLVGALGRAAIHVNAGGGERQASAWNDWYDQGWSEAWLARIRLPLFIGAIALVVIAFLAGMAVAAPRSTATGSPGGRIDGGSAWTPRPGPSIGAPRVVGPTLGAPTHVAGGRWSDPAALKSAVPKSVHAGAFYPRGNPIRGIASTYGDGWDGWIAWPKGPGWRLRVCGPAACRTVLSTDAGPDKAMQRAGRIIDLDVPTFEAIAGGPWRRLGLVRVTVTVLGRA